MIAYSILLYSLLAFSSCQYQKTSKDAAILSEARYLAVDGQFGSAYKQEDGVEFKEESDGQGNRKGSYSYVDPNGVRRTVSYTAGKDGFIATGDHLPVPPVPVAAAALPAAAAPDAAPPNSGQYIPDSGQYNPQDDYDDDSQSKNYENQYTYQFVPTPNPQLQYNPVPQYNLAPQPSFSPVHQLQYQSANQAAAPIGYSKFITEPPHHQRLSYPGKLSVNRSPGGFSYTFNQV